MNANKAIRDILHRESLSPSSVSVDMGHKYRYLNTLLSERDNCRSDTLVKFAEATGYELLLRSKSDGFEFIIDE